MKKTLSFCLIFIFLMTVFPINAYAYSPSSSEHDEIIKLACDIFPEYKDRILDSDYVASRNARSSNSRSIVLTETRDVSASERLIYSEYSDGLVLLTNYSFNKSVTVNSSLTSAGATNIDINIRATCGESGYTGVVTCNNIKFTLISNSYDRIDSVGTVTTSGSCSYSSPNVKYNEDSSGNAYILYSLHFWPGNNGYASLRSLLKLDVGDNNYIVTHLDDG